MTARLLRANAADIRHYAQALEIAADYYQKGSYHDAHVNADFAFAALWQLCRAWLILRLKHLHVYKMRPIFMRSPLRPFEIARRKVQIARAKSFETLDNKP